MTGFAVDRKQPRWARFAVAVARKIFPILARWLFNLHVDGRWHVPREGSFILAGNHAGFLDGPLVVVVSPRRVRSLAKAELFRGGVGTLLLAGGQIPVSRGRPDRMSLKAALTELAAGGGIAVFPEGTRGAGELEEIRDGVAYLALRSGAPIVPVACLGTGVALPKGARLPRWRAPVTISFGAPFSVSIPEQPRSRASVAAASEEIRVRLKEHLTAVRSGT